MVNCGREALSQRDIAPFCVPEQGALLGLTMDGRSGEPVSAQDALCVAVRPRGWAGQRWATALTYVQWFENAAQ